MFKLPIDLGIADGLVRQERYKSTPSIMCCMSKASAQDQGGTSCILMMHGRNTRRLRLSPPTSQTQTIHCQRIFMLKKFSSLLRTQLHLRKVQRKTAVWKCKINSALFLVQCVCAMSPVLVGTVLWRQTITMPFTSLTHGNNGATRTRK